MFCTCPKICCMAKPKSINVYEGLQIEAQRLLLRVNNNNNNNNNNNHNNNNNNNNNNLKLNSLSGHALMKSSQINTYQIIMFFKERKNSRSRVENHKVYPHMTSDLGIKARATFWEASALTPLRHPCKIVLQ